MAALKFTRNKDYSDDADLNAGGRDTIDPAGLDGEMDEVATITDDHADKLDLILRDDLLMVSDILQGHEFSSTAITVLGALLSGVSSLNYRQNWATATDYGVADLATESGNVYFCLVAHASGVFATDLVAGKWFLFCEKGAGASFPGGGSADDLLYYNGASEVWSKLTAAMAPLHALLASPTFTGVVGVDDINIAGRFNFTVETVAFVAAGNAFDFDTKQMKKVAVTGDYTGANSVSNITQGDTMEIHFDNTSGSEADLLWDSNWTWMGYAPSVLATGKKGVLSLRAIYGATSSDIVAIWSVEP